MTLKEKEIKYGITALNDKELLEYLGLKHTSLDSFKASSQYNMHRELMNRLSKIELPKIKRSQELYELLKDIWRNDYEVFVLVCMNNSGKVLSKTTLTNGTIGSCIVNVRRIVKLALDQNASSVAIAHNHPSNDPKPSSADNRITQSVKEALSFFDIRLNDHLIICDQDYYSYADSGEL